MCGRGDALSPACRPAPRPFLSTAASTPLRHARPSLLGHRVRGRPIARLSHRSRRARPLHRASSSRTTGSCRRPLHPPRSGSGSSGSCARTVTCDLAGRGARGDDPRGLSLRAGSVDPRRWHGPSWPRSPRAGVSRLDTDCVERSAFRLPMRTRMRAISPLGCPGIASWTTPTATRSSPSEYLGTHGQLPPTRTMGFPGGGRGLRAERAQPSRSYARRRGPRCTCRAGRRVRFWPQPRLTEGALPLWNRPRPSPATGIFQFDETYFCRVDVSPTAPILAVELASFSARWGRSPSARRTLMPVNRAAARRLHVGRLFMMFSPEICSGLLPHLGIRGDVVRAMS